MLQLQATKYSETLYSRNQLHYKRQQIWLCAKTSLSSRKTVGRNSTFVPSQHFSLSLVFSQICGVMLGFPCRRCVLTQQNNTEMCPRDTNMTETGMCHLFWNAFSLSLIHLCLPCLQSRRVSDSDITGRSSQTTRLCENDLS